MTLLLTAILLISFFFYHFYYKRRNLPPGPLPLPFLGNLLAIQRSRAHDDVFLRWRRRFGPVFTYWMGPVPVVCVADYRKMVETFLRDGDAYEGRFVPELKRITNVDGIRGLVFSSGPLWKEQRRFTMHVLRDFGVGKDQMQEQILDEIRLMFAKIDTNLEKCTEEEQNLAKMMDLAVGSILHQMLFGYKLHGEKEAEFWEIKRLMGHFMGSFSAPMVKIWSLYPQVLDRIPPFHRIRPALKRRADRVGDFVMQRIRQHQRERAANIKEAENNNKDTEDFVDVYLREMEARENDKSDGQEHYFSIEQLKDVCVDLWFAGQESTSLTLSWAIALIMLDQKCIKKLHAELDSVIGSPDRMVTVADKSQLPYTNAVVHESVRVAFLLALNLNHALTRDVNLDGYLLPKGTCVVPQLIAVYSDETIFDRPDQFIPERFLDTNGQFKCPDEFIPFGLGKRQCLGQAQARMELFLIIANIFNRYKLYPGKVLPSMEHKMATFFVERPSFTCRVKKLR